MKWQGQEALQKIENLFLTALRLSLRATEMCDLKWLLNALTLSTKALKEFEMLND